jgi:4-hydroxy-tetrahydrodipicolinate synthase
MLKLGAHGIISVASHLVGKQISGMIYSYLKGDVKKADEANASLAAIFSALFLVSNPIPVKYALNQVSFRVGKPRLPLCEPDEKTAKAIMDVVKKYKIDLPVK